MPEEKELSITLVTSDFRGDHAADVRIACKYKQNETLEQLVKRLGGLPNQADHIEIRIIRG